MFRYFGAKNQQALSYPAPEYSAVIEPFAGSMSYSLKHRPERAIGIERDPEVVALWHRIVNMPADEIRDFQAPPVGQRSYDRWVIQAATSNANWSSSYRTVTPFILEHVEQQKALALKHLDYARTSVLYALGDYRQAPDIECTWFIDPPYIGVRNGYRFGSRSIDYAELAEWCMTRRGQVIVCEGPRGNWLPFQFHKVLQGTPCYERNSKDNEEHVLVRRTHAFCAVCEIAFPAARADARFCSARCRQRASRKSRNT